MDQLPPFLPQKSNGMTLALQKTPIVYITTRTRLEAATKTTLQMALY